MDRILRAGVAWHDALAHALAEVERPISIDSRLYAARADGSPIPRRQRDDSTPARPAATLLVVYPDDGGRLVVPLTVRHDRLRSHAGEVSLPGGAVDPDDASHEAAALREAWEEIGLEPSSVRIAGELDGVWIPVSNFELRPIVGTVAVRPVLVPHDDEVAAILELPLDALFRPDAIEIEEFESRGVRLRAGVYHHAGVRIWGATALTLGMFVRALGGRATDVSAASAPSS
jgi:8-oxo-dGTP pyrophosphatase MutT (NUDIX family)